MEDSSEDARQKSELWHALHGLAQGRGVQRKDILKALNGELVALQKRLGLDISHVDSNDNEKLRNRIQDAIVRFLTIHVETLTPPRGRSRRTYAHAVLVSFNALLDKTHAELVDKDITQRRAWLANDKVSEAYRVTVRTSQRYLNSAIDQIEQRLLGFEPELVVVGDSPSTIDGQPPDEPLRAPGAVESSQSQSSIQPTTPYIDTFSRLTAVHLSPPKPIRAHGKGFLGSLGFPTLRSRAAVTNRVMAEVHLSPENPRLTVLTNNDEPTAVLALSGGTATGARQAGREILYDYDSYDSDRTMAAALVFVGGREGRRNAAVALKTLAQNQSRPIGPGRLDIVSRGILRLAGRNLELAVALYGMYQELSRANGRIDLGGWWNDIDKVSDADAAGAAAALYVAKAGGGKQEQFMAHLRAYTQTLADLTVLDGVSRTNAIDLVCGHPHQVRQLIGDDSTDKDGTRLCMGTLERMLGSAVQEHRVEATVIILEIHSMLARANQSSRELIDQFFVRRGLDPVAADFAEQLAVHTGLADFTADQLRAKARNPNSNSAS
jgi:hypothetical protein